MTTGPTPTSRNVGSPDACAGNIDGIGIVHVLPFIGTAIQICQRPAHLYIIMLAVYLPFDDVNGRYVCTSAGNSVFSGVRIPEHFDERQFGFLRSDRVDDLDGRVDHVDTANQRGNGQHFGAFVLHHGEVEAQLVAVAQGDQR